MIYSVVSAIYDYYRRVTYRTFSDASSVYSMVQTVGTELRTTGWYRNCSPSASAQNMPLATCLIVYPSPTFVISHCRKACKHFKFHSELNPTTTTHLSSTVRLTLEGEGVIAPSIVHRVFDRVQEQARRARLNLIDSGLHELVVDGGRFTVHCGICKTKASLTDRGNGVGEGSTMPAQRYLDIWETMIGFCQRSHP